MDSNGDEHQKTTLRKRMRMKAGESLEVLRKLGEIDEQGNPRTSSKRHMGHGSKHVKTKQVFFFEMVT